MATPKKKNPNSTAAHYYDVPTDTFPAVSTASPMPVKVSDGTDTADVIDLGTYAGVGVYILDALGNPISSFGGGTQYTEDDAAAANPSGTVPVLVRQDTPASVTSANGDNIAQRGTNYGAAYVQILSSSGAFIDSFGGGTQYTEGDTDASITGTAVMWEDSGDTLSAASVAKPLPMQISDGTRTATVRDTGSTDSLNVAITDASGNQITTFGGQAYTEDAASSGGESLTLAGAIRQDTLSSSTSADGDYSSLKTTSAGALWTQSPSTTIAGATVKTSDFDSGAGTDTVPMMGIALPASGGAVAGGTTTNPVVVRDANTALTASSPANYTTTTTSGSAVASNSNRTGLVLQNISNNNIFLGLGVTAEVNKGIWLAPNGGTWMMTKNTFTTSAINAIADLGSSNILTIQEFT